MIKTSLILHVTGLYLLLFNLQPALAVTTNLSDCEITYKTIGSPVLISIEGESESPCVGKLEIEGNDLSKSKITLDLKDLDSGMSLRDKHLKDNYLEVNKFPNATITKIDAQDFEKQQKGTQSGKSSFSAVLELHGVSKPIKGKYDIKDGNLYRGEFEIEITDFGISRPDFMGVKVVEKVSINFEFKSK